MYCKGRRGAVHSFAVLVAVALCHTAVAADQHLGVASCAGSTCHGATRPFSDATVRQDEYLTWHRRDRHSRAFATLRSERSRRIAANLGLGAPENEATCLVCHADNVPAAQRGERFLLSDGVGCETCHGGAQRWLVPHARGYASNDQRVASGLYPTWDAGARAELCLSCHLGSERRPMSHAMLGAGHPPLLFELDTFSAVQPAHYDLDRDYVLRKGKADGARNWAVGQAVTARKMLVAWSDLTADGAVFPELAGFDCNACHHPMQPARWDALIAPGVPPGRPRLAAVSLHFTQQWLEVVRPELAARWRAGVHDVHRAGTRSLADLSSAAKNLKKILEGEVLPLTARHSLSAAELRELIHQVLDSGAGARAGDYSTAEQTAMAASVLVTALAEREGSTVPKPLREAADAIYDVVDGRIVYDAEKMRRALRTLLQQIELAYPVKGSAKH